MLLLPRISLKGMTPLFKKTRLFYFDLFQTIVVKSCWESCVHHFTSHLIHYSNYSLYYLGNAMLLCPPPPHIQCWDCSWGFSCKISHHIVPEKSNIEKGEGVISKVMLPSQHFLKTTVNSFLRITQNLQQIGSWYSP